MANNFVFPIVILTLFIFSNLIMNKYKFYKELDILKKGIFYLWRALNIYN